MRPAPAVDAAPPVTPNAPRPPELADARRVQANFLETLVFRFLATPLALLLVVLQSRYLHADGRGTFVLVVLTVTVVSRLFGQLGYAVTNRMQQRGLELRALVRRALALAVALGAAGTAAIVAWASVARGVGVVAGAIAAAALVPTIVTQSISGSGSGLGVTSCSSAGRPRLSQLNNRAVRWRLNVRSEPNRRALPVAGD